MSFDEKNRKRAMKMQGLSKLDFACISQIKVTQKKRKMPCNIQ